MKEFGKLAIHASRCGSKCVVMSSYIAPPSVAYAWLIRTYELLVARHAEAGLPAADLCVAVSATETKDGQVNAGIRYDGSDHHAFALIGASLATCAAMQTIAAP